jgi:hypothetical protein
VARTASDSGTSFVASRGTALSAHDASAREARLVRYVDQLQGRVQVPDDSAWWARQLGRTRESLPPTP